MAKRAKALSEILQLASVLVGMGKMADRATERACTRDVLLAVSALRRAVSRAGRRHLDGIAAHGSPRERRPTLSPRERQIVRLLSQGASYKDIANELGIAFSTAQSRVKAIYGKLGVHSKNELASLLRQGTDERP